MFLSWSCFCGSNSENHLSDDAGILPFSVYFLSNFVGQRRSCILVKCRCKGRGRMYGLQIQIATIFLMEIFLNNKNWKEFFDLMHFWQFPYFFLLWLKSEMSQKILNLVIWWNMAILHTILSEILCRLVDF